MKIILSTINTRFIHPSLGLRYLYANMGELQKEAKVLEFVEKESAAQIAERLVLEEAEIIGFGIYIWNTSLCLEVIEILKSVQPNTKIIIGGPEVSYEYQDSSLFHLADVLIPGEADLAFAVVCKKLLNNEPVASPFLSEAPSLTHVKFPYRFYDSEHLGKQLIYVELSRGCVFRCEFCLSSLDKSVRSFPIEMFLGEMGNLLKRGCRIFKFVDRTFNLNSKVVVRVFEYFLSNWREGLFLHFEMVPDLLPDTIKDWLPKFPKGGIQFEIGIQSFNEKVGQLISRKMNLEKTIANFNFLKRETEVHIHADLIIGLPGENVESLAKGFDQLWHLDPDEIQIGILKYLKGTPIARHHREYGMVYQSQAPYEILKTKDIDFIRMQELKRLAHYFEIFCNSKRFKRTMSILFKSEESPFFSFYQFSNWIWRKTKQEYAFRLKRQFELLANYLLEKKYCRNEDLIPVLAEDFLDEEMNPLGSKHGLPDYIRIHVEQKLKLRKKEVSFGLV